MPLRPADIRLHPRRRRRRIKTPMILQPPTIHSVASVPKGEGGVREQVQHTLVFQLWDNCRNIFFMWKKFLGLKVRNLGMKNRILGKIKGTVEILSNALSSLLERCNCMPKFCRKFVAPVGNCNFLPRLVVFNLLRCC